MLFFGDLIFNGGTPFLLMGSVAGAVEVLETVVAPLGAQTIVPGHGPVFGDRGPIDDTLDYLRFVLDVAAGCRDAGLSPLQAARDADLGGGPIDIVTALADMVAYNGGLPLTCLA